MTFAFGGGPVTFAFRGAPATFAGRGGLGGRVKEMPKRVVPVVDFVYEHAGESRRSDKL